MLVCYVLLYVVYCGHYAVRSDVYLPKPILYACIIKMTKTVCFNEKDFK